MEKEKLALFAFSFVILAFGGPCGFLDKLVPGGNATNQTLTHLACQNGACVSAMGSGADECGSDSDCLATNTTVPATHSACANYKCVQVPGAGANSCLSDNDCGRNTTTTPPVNNTPPAAGCSQYKDCSSCLQTVPDQCKWCIQGSVCTDASDTSSCFGGLGWLTKDYQCNLASR